ncbi:MAG: RraA family protein [Tannerella sp.]|jgi:regulator of RNase E activity RraA|nr:RraA family protein [Tannerella sp.]
MNKTDKKTGMMMAGIIIFFIAATFNINVAASNGKKQTGDDEQRKADNKVLLEIFKNFRVADVRDAMDWIGYHNFGSIEPSVRPLFRTRVVGIARTARYLPFEGPYPDEKGDAYTQWQGWYYGNVCTYPWMDEIGDGDFVAIDVSGVNVGLLGSENTLRAKLKGARGFVINGSGIRDTDEVIKQQIPVWSHFTAQSMVQCKIRFDAKDVPIAIGGVTIHPGDIIVADGDGVIVVPRKVAKDVAKYADQILNSDKDTRRSLYEKLNWEPDETVTK